MMRYQRSSAVTTGAASSSCVDERRQYPAAREAFEYAYSILESFYHPDTGWQGRSLHHLSFGLVRGNFPHLAYEETNALLAAVTRVFAERHTVFLARGREPSSG